MRGRLRLEVRSAATGETLALREDHNTVMRSGAELVAMLFSAGGAPITHMGVGTSDGDPDSVTTSALLNEGEGGGPGLQEPTAAEISPDAFTIETDEVQRLVRVRVRGTLPAAAAVGTVREAGLLSRREDGDVLYNRVTFPPVEKGDDHELTMFWEVEFPFGDLQWLS